jgi:hypothetical protein
VSPLRRQSSTQRGAVALALVSVLLLLGTYFMLGSLNVAAVRVDRDRVSDAALLRAKEALIAYAVSDANRPGELPCPDVDDDGSSTPAADYAGINCVSLIGRLPFRTLGLPDLRDDAGERLWYALSNDFRARGAVPGALPLNNDTAFRAGNLSLSITGQQAADNLVAVVFAPGAVLRRQDGVALQNRAGAGRLNAVNYLDFAGAQSNSDNDRIFAAAAKSENFNDRLMPIHSDDIMGLVERRAGRELAQRLREHYDNWANAANITPASRKGFYPWAAPFGDPANMQAGQNNTQEGLLPLSAASMVWTSASITGLLGNCNGVGTNQISCTAVVLLGAGGDVTARLGNIATTFVDPPDGSEVSTGGLVLLGAPATSWALNAGAGRLDFSSNITFLGTGLVTVTVRAPPRSAWVTDATDWVMTNQWWQLAYYALAPDFAITGTGSCGACLTLANTAAPANKEAVVVMTGRALPLAGPQATRPIVAPVPVTQFLEGANLTTGDQIFEHNMKTATFNDYPIAVRP